MREFRSRLLSLDGGSRLELMVSAQEASRHAHIVISVGSCPTVDRLVKEMEQAGVQIVSGPRITGDGYDEAVIDGLLSLPRTFRRTQPYAAVTRCALSLQTIRTDDRSKILFA
jgi:hypothetical protein